MSNQFLIIDPQNDFCDIPGAALPVPGAQADMTRAALFLAAAGRGIGQVTVTLDSHPSVAIERTSFWCKADGSAVAPFTQITHQEVLEGAYRPRSPVSRASWSIGASSADPDLRDWVLFYLSELERRSAYRLVVWPVHCVLGTWGHDIVEPLAVELANREATHQRAINKVLKGLNPLTEQYSALKAEVPVPEDAGTRLNQKLIARLRPLPDDWLFVAGEAGSHCVASTLRHLYENMEDPRRALPRIVLLSDCMSPVPGFEAEQARFLEDSRKLGARVMTALEALALLPEAGAQDAIEARQRLASPPIAKAQA